MSLDTEVLIIGAGMSGIGLAIQLIRRFGVYNFELIEKSNDVGGTWLANTYPSCGCDVASHFYSYSFALNPDWSQKFSMQPEIQQYFRSVAEQYHVSEHIQFQSVVENAKWDERSKVWSVTVQELTTKTRRVRKAKILVSAVGALSVPKKYDDLPGVENFQGRMFHSAEWDHSFDWKDKEVVVLGNESLPPHVHTMKLIENRKRMLSNPVPPHYGSRPKCRQENNTILSTSTVSGSA
jgi:cation diffusion facilitator CzcD-associated flavoprotein CzcO